MVIHHTIELTTVTVWCILKGVSPLLFAAVSVTIKITQTNTHTHTPTDNGVELSKISGSKPNFEEKMW